MLFGFEFAIGMMLALVVVPLAILFLVLAFKMTGRMLKQIGLRLERSAVAQFVAKSAFALTVGALAIAWIAFSATH